MFKKTVKTNGLNTYINTVLLWSFVLLLLLSCKNDNQNGEGVFNK